MAPTCVLQATEDTNANGHRGPVQPSRRSPMADVSEEKNALRARAAELRRQAHAADPAGHASLAVRDHFLGGIAVAPHAIIGGYWPTGTELDVRPLLIALHER